MLPPLYKYLDVQGAKLTLENRTFRHAKPSDFNDDMDMTVQNIFPECLEDALNIINDSFVDVLIENLSNYPVTSQCERNQKIIPRQEALRKNPSLAELIRENNQNQDITDIYNLEYMNDCTLSFLSDLNDYLQQNRVLCVSKKNNSQRMWHRYADNHKGIAIRILPNKEKNSKFILFRKVNYQEIRPPLYESAVNFLENSLFGDKEATVKAIIDNIIYTKTLDWEYENEYRLCIPIRDNENWDVLPYYPEEISELYLGARMEDSVREQVITLAQKINPEIIIYQTSLQNNDTISFERISF